MTDAQAPEVAEKPRERAPAGAAARPEGAEVPEAQVAAAPPQVGLVGITSLLIGVVTFVVLLGGICAMWVFVVRKPAAAPPAVAKSEAVADKGPLVYYSLIDRYTFATTLPPLGERTVTFEYGIAVQIHKLDETRLKKIVDGQQLMPKLQSDIRRIISQEDYVKLRSQDLVHVAGQIRDVVNANLGEKLVTDVVFPVWNVW